MSEQIQFAGFLKLIQISRISADAPDTKSEIRVNPLNICAYYPHPQKQDEITILIVSGERYWIDLPFAKFDSFFENEVKRGFEINE